MKLRTHKKVPRQILTTCGYITFERYICRPADPESATRLMELEHAKAVAPLDIALGIAHLPFKISVSMMLEIAYWAIKLDSYQETEDFYERTYHVKIGDDTIRGVVNYIGSIIHAQDCAAAARSQEAFDKCAIPFDHKRKGVLYLQTDGAALNTRIKDNDGSTWRENKLGLAFSSDNIHFWNNSKGERQHRILKREYISYIGSVSEFKYHFLALALRAGYGQYTDTVLLSDGATWIRNMKEEMFPDIQQILDLFHLKENVYDFAKFIFRGDDSKVKPWAGRICEKLEDGQWKQVLQELEPHKDITASAGANHVNLYTYIFNNRDNIDYPTYQKAGYFVGSGAIESGNRVVLQSRLKRPGMRWNVATAQNVLALKAKLESGLWDGYVVPFVHRYLGNGGALSQ